MKNLSIDGIKVIEGQQYIHTTSGCIWTIKRNFYNELVFDSGIIERKITVDRILQVEPI